MFNFGLLVELLKKGGQKPTLVSREFIKSKYFLPYSLQIKCHQFKSIKTMVYKNNQEDIVPN